MSKKLSQSEIDALVASLLTGEAPSEETPAQPEAAAPLAGTPSPAAPEEAIPAAPAQPAAPAPVIGLTLENMPFELIVDLGKITQPEVDAAIATYRGSVAAATAPVATAPVAPAPVRTPAAAAMVAPAQSVAVPPSPADYVASQAQAAQQTRRALSMASLGGVLNELELTVTVELGKARLSLHEVLALGPGSVVTLDKVANTPVEVSVNGLQLMKAEVLAIGEKYGVRITQSSLNVKAAS